MAGRNVRKIYIDHTYYHVYNRGVNKELIFKDDEDYRTFLNIFKRLLSPEVFKDSFGRKLQNFHGEIELRAYCLMPNHFHILIYQVDSESISKFVHCLSATYSKYFNKKYERIGPVFQNRYRASAIDREQYFEYIPDYIHLNPTKFLKWPYSSLSYYLGDKSADWFCAPTSLGLSRREYIERLKLLSETKLANKTMHQILELDAS